MGVPMRQEGPGGARCSLSFVRRGAVVVSDVVDMGGPRIGDEEREAVDRVLRSGRLAQGPEVEAFEAELARDLAGTAHAVAVASGSAALDLCLVALGVGRGGRGGDHAVHVPRDRERRASIGRDRPLRRHRR